MPTLTDIPFTLDAAKLMSQAHAESGTPYADEFTAFLEEARALGRPKAIYRESFIEGREGDTITIEGVTFTSRMLRQNLEGVQKVFAYVVTCGTELDAAAEGDTDVLKQYWRDLIKSSLLHAARNHLGDHLDRTFRLGKTANMNPGSGDANVWPIEQQKELFSLLGNVEGAIGVRLTESFLMMPNKTVSGIRFATEKDFRSCQVCHRKDCPGRSAEFDHEMWEGIQGKKEG